MANPKWSLQVLPASKTRIKKANWHSTRKSVKIKTACYGLASNLLRSTWQEPYNNALIDPAVSSLLRGMLWSHYCIT